MGRSGAEAGVDAAIVGLLKQRAGRWHSGQALSSELGLSRTAVWKHIKGLRRAGYAIEASPSRGYRLDLSRLPFNAVEIGAGLATEFVGRSLHFHEELDSTNRTAHELAAAGAPEGAAVVAESQRAGRGRLGRRWHSPPGLNIHTSIVLRPAVEPHRAHGLTLMAAVALAETIASTAGVRPALKWPNDVLIEGRKTAGILLELVSEADRVGFVVVGMGVNVNSTADDFPPELRGRATSLRQAAGTELSRTALLQALYLNVEKWYKVLLHAGLGPVLDAWRGYFGHEGRTVRVRGLGGETVEGVCAGVDSDGALLVRRPSGRVERVLAGDVEDFAEDAGRRHEEGPPAPWDRPCS
ncbi:MAG TPA: biotin--[acetyl-CoA-carboxylase] ligase [Deltaproteobacteria bacterium]|nr:biotin--[acetyl-CoA-carboxylase] ligase [Deltaproteobacteria bacterium]